MRAEVLGAEVLTPTIRSGMQISTTTGNCQRLSIVSSALAMTNRTRSALSTRPRQPTQVLIGFRSSLLIGCLSCGDDAISQSTPDASARSLTRRLGAAWCRLTAGAAGASSSASL